MIFITFFCFTQVYAQEAIPISVSLKQTSNNIGDGFNNGNQCSNNGCSDTESRPNCGYNCWSPKDMWIEYRFRGERFAIYGSQDDSHGKFNVFIDGQLTDVVDLYINQTAQIPKVLVYTSEILRYDDHTVRIESQGDTIDLYKIVYWPNVKAERKNISEFTSTSNWNTRSDGIGGHEQYTTDKSDDYKKTIRVTCSKIWVYGSVGPDHGDVGIEIDGKTVYITEKSDTAKEGVLIYETDPIEFKEHTIVIKKADNNQTKNIYIRNIYYLTEEIPFLPVPISVSLKQTTNNLNQNYDGCTDDTCNATNLDICGLNCWEPAQMHFEYRFRGEQFALYGSKDDNHNSIKIYLDGQLQDTVSLYIANEISPIPKVEVYKSGILRYDDHLVRVESTATVDMYKLVYWPSVNSIRVNITDITSSTAWDQEFSLIGDIQQHTTQNADAYTKSIDKTFSRIWVYGSTGPDFGDVRIKVDDESVVISEKSTNLIEGVLLYDSDPLVAKNHKVQISKADQETSKKIYIRFIYYLPDDVPLLPVPISVSLLQTTNHNFISGTTNHFTNNNDCTNTACSDDNTQNQPLCGINCWQPKDMHFEYQFRGEQFALYGSKNKNHGSFKIFLDGELHETIDQYITSNSPIPKVRLYKSGILPYGNHTVKVVANNDKVIDMYKLVYWPSVNAVRINSSQLETMTSWNSKSDYVGGFKQLTASQEDIKSTTLRCSKIWVYGTVDSIYGDLEIQIDETRKIISETSDTQINGSLLFESDLSSSELHTFNFRKGDKSDKSVNIQYIYYIPSPRVPSSTVPISVSLKQTTSNIGDNNFNNEGSCSNHQCSNDVNANEPQCGVNCWRPLDMQIEYKFRGEQFGVYGTHDNDHGGFNVYLDGQLIDSVNIYRNFDQKPKILVYLSEILRYDDHTVRIESQGDTIDLYKIVYWPNVKAERKNISEFTSTSNWNTRSDGIGGHEQYTTDKSDESKKTIRVTCSKIWVYGSVGPNHGDVGIEIDGKTVYITEKSDTAKEGVLIYETDPIEFKEHTIVIKKADNNQDKNIYIRNIYYLTEEIPLLPVPISVSLKQTTNNLNPNYAGCTDTPCSNNITLNEPLCGLNCWEPAQMNFEYRFKGERFALYGSKNDNHNSIKIYLDGQLQDTATLYMSDEIQPIPKVEVYKSGILRYDDHLVRVESTATVDMYKLVYWPSVNSIRINSSQLETKTKTDWNSESDLIGGFQQWTTNQEEIKTTSLKCSKMWFYGSISPNNGDLDIQIDDNRTTVHEQIENQETNGVLLLETKHLLYEDHKILIQKKGADDKRVNLRTIFCEHSSYATPTPPPALVDILSCSFTDSESSTKLFSERCNYTSNSENKIKVDIFRTQFTDFKDEGDGGAIHIVNGELDCNKIEFRNCQSTNGGAGGAIYVDNSFDKQNFINLDKLTFIQCRAGYGGALYLHSEFITNPFVIKGCIFESNVAYSNENENNDLFGGSSIFLDAKNATIMRCRFRGDTSSSGSIKIVNDIPNSEALKLQVEEKEIGSLHISDCSFEQNSNSIFFVNKNDDYNVEIINCHFSGKTNDEYYYIDGLLKLKNKPKFLIQSCTFDHNIKESVRADFINNEKMNNSSNKYSLGISNFGLLIVGFACLLVCTLILIYLNNKKRNEQNNENTGDSLEI